MSTTLVKNRTFFLQNWIEFSDWSGYNEHDLKKNLLIGIVRTETRQKEIAKEILPDFDNSHCPHSIKRPQHSKMACLWQAPLVLSMSSRHSSAAYPPKTEDRSTGSRTLRSDILHPPLSGVSGLTRSLSLIADATRDGDACYKLSTIDDALAQLTFFPGWEISLINSTWLRRH